MYGKTKNKGERTFGFNELLMLRKVGKSVMLSKAQPKYLRHPSSYPFPLYGIPNIGTKNEGFAQDDCRFCAASKHRSNEFNSLRNLSELLVYCGGFYGSIERTADRIAPEIH